MERRFAVHAGAYRKALTLAIAFASTHAIAAPSGADAKAQFDRGVAAYTKGDYQTANDAFEKSAALESDVETLFAWAQTERKLDRCDKAIELYGRLLGMDLPAENKAAITVQLGECKQIVATARPVEPVHPVQPEHAPQVAPPVQAPVSTASPGSPPEGHSWWHDPVGDGLLGVGVVGLGVGAALLISGHSADQDKAHAATYAEYLDLQDRARSRGELGVIGIAAGSALVAASIVWYATHREQPQDRAGLSGWLAPSGGGVALTARF